MTDLAYKEKHMNEKPEFQVGDIVEAFGVRGKVTEVTAFVYVKYDTEYAPRTSNNSFLPDGRSCSWHVTPSLKLIERPKKTKKVKVWVNVWPRKNGGITLSVHDQNKADALYCVVTDPTGITQEIEVEVLDE
jgi:ribosomal 30S subunit maturation factor RimM